MKQKTEAYQHMKRVTMIKVRDSIDDLRLKQSEVAKIVNVTQPRISDLMNGKIELFSIDSLLQMQLAIYEYMVKNGK